ncbi:MAG: acyl-CoA thioesterase [Polaromonas sp.]|nr:acyl-CoA thioesterase [Polaromonas sp.]
MKFTTPKKIRFHHCDPAGIVFYPQFFYLLHEAQEDFFVHIGFAEHSMINGGHGVPIVDLKCQFLGMCRNGDDVDITLALSRLGNSSIGMDYEILGGGQVKLRASGVVVYSKVPDGKPVRIPDDLRQALQPYLHNIAQKA